ncbi:hypothetical protein Tco_0045098 [Tanacetum coccineum]
METQKLLLKDEDGEEVDVHLFRSMIGSLMYLTSSRPDIMFTVCACARYQVNLKVSHLHAVKTIFRYLKGQPKLGLWYPKDSPFDLVTYTDSDYAGTSLDRKSTTRGRQFLGSILISWDCNDKKLIQMIKIHTDKNVADLLTKAFDNGIGVNAVDSKLMLLGINLLLLGKINAARHKLTAAGEIVFLAKPVESGFEQIVDFLNAHTIKYALTVNPMIYTSCIEQFWATAKLNDEEGTDCLPNATIFEELTRIGAKTTAWNKFSSTMASAIICLATNQKFNFSKYIFESMVKNLDNAAVIEELDDSLVRVATTATGLDAKRDSGNIDKIQSKATPNEPSSLGTSSDEASLGDQKDASKQERKINDIDKDAEITLVQQTQGRYSDKEMFDIGVLDGDEVLAESKVSVKDMNLSVDEVTLAQALAALKSVKVYCTRPKAKGLVIHEEEQATTPTVSSQQPSKDKGKGIMVEEPVKMKKKDQISLDEELAFKLQAEEEEERFAREKSQREEETNIVSWDNIQAMIDADYQMAQQMQEE